MALKLFLADLLADYIRRSSQLSYLVLACAKATASEGGEGGI
jgi:hypothetical protein